MLFDGSGLKDQVCWSTEYLVKDPALQTCGCQAPLFLSGVLPSCWTPLNESDGKRSSHSLCQRSCPAPGKHDSLWGNRRREVVSLKITNKRSATVTRFMNSSILIIYSVFSDFSSRMSNYMSPRWCFQFTIRDKDRSWRSRLMDHQSNGWRYRELKPSFISISVYEPIRERQTS